MTKGKCWAKAVRILYYYFIVQRNLKWHTHKVIYLPFVHKQEINSKLCIICPKHKYKLTLAKGECLYKGNNPKEKPPVPRWYSKGVKQRTHTVTENNGEIYVKLSDNPNWIESDYYQGEKGKIERAKAEASEKETSWQ